MTRNGSVVVNFAEHRRRRAAAQRADDPGPFWLRLTVAAGLFLVVALMPVWWIGVLVWLR